MALLRRLVCLAAALSAAHGFVITPNARWSLPVDSRSTAGLSRGLSFVIDSGAQICPSCPPSSLSHPPPLSFADLCAVMQPRFIEENFIVSCEAIRETVLRAFLAWSVNSPWISFYNVSHLCADPSDPASCEAEIRVSAVAGNADDPVSRVTLNTSDVAPLDTTTASRPLLGVKTIDAVHIELFAHEGMCWYLDGNHCKSLVSQTFDIQALMVFLYLLFLALGVVWLLWRGCHFVKKARQYHVRAATPSHHRPPQRADTRPRLALTSPPSPLLRCASRSTHSTVTSS